jgi:FKBP-type peptidyl-prolyl cis-trans isomerase FkpA
MRASRCIIVGVLLQLIHTLDSLMPGARPLAVALIALLVVTAGCAGSATAPSSYAAFSQSDIVVGTGTEATAGKTATVNYTGWIYDSSKPEQRGAQFDSSIGKSPFPFVLGAGSVIAGWEQGVPGMKVGGVRRLVVPPALGYGGTRQGSIPPHATLVFEIEMLNVQ